MLNLALKTPHTQNNTCVCLPQMHRKKPKKAKMTNLLRDKQLWEMHHILCCKSKT